jgi:hypothetical protein
MIEIPDIKKYSRSDYELAGYFHSIVNWEWRASWLDHVTV